jgi:putative ABC transport system permease protein
VTIVILQQLAYISHKDLGYDKEHVVVLPVDKPMLDHYDDLKKAITANPGVVSVSGAYESLTDINWGDGISKGTGENEKGITVNAIPVDEDFVKTLGLKIVAGSDYTRADVQQMDTTDEGKNLHYTFMLNEAAVHALGWTPEEAIGKTITKGQSGIIKAVVKDFHFHSFHEPITPLVIFLDKRMVYSMFVKISGAHLPATLTGLEKTWKERVAHRPFEYHFLDEDYNELYKTEQRMGAVFTTFSSLAILLACLGLFALTAYTMVRRTKEIGIRKVLGATVSDILTLVSKDFLRLVLIALLIASPIAFYGISKWLQSFTYKVSVQWWVFAAAGIATLLIAFLTVSLQAIKTTLANPVRNLRTE